MGEADRIDDRHPLLSTPSFVRFWLADSVSIFGTYITAQALQLLAVATLSASPFEVGVLRAAQWTPYLAFGLFVGVWIDRYRRKPVLVAADLIRAGVLASIPLAAAFHVLTMPMLIMLVLIFGAVSLAYDAAHQSFLPGLVPARVLTRANVRLEQSAAVAQVAGQGIAGWLIKIVGPPLAILVDAVSYVISGFIVAGLRVAERPRTPARNYRNEFRDGLRWVYGHAGLAPLVISTHVWFFFTSMVAALYAYFVVVEVGFDATAHGLTLAVGGGGAVAGSSIAGWVERRGGIGPAIIGCRWLSGLGYLLIPLAHNGKSGFAMLCVAQFLFWLSIGVSSPLEMSYRQSVTPDRLLGRVNATARSMNRGAVVLGAPIGGALAQWLGLRPTLWIAVGGVFCSAAMVGGSRFRHARMHR
ncbi:MFS transporter [Nocardia tenerifensis]|uniref:MFS transporter n=1 Tax=Nocardia tenerifensis TaxID=228006 RepID=UPI00030786CC|nr:MFS transporter [Nocardia tenerifensis]